LNTGFPSSSRLRQNGLGKSRNLRHIKAMTKLGPQTTSPRSRFTEHRPQSSPTTPAANPAAKSAEITAGSKPEAVLATTATKKPKEIGGPKGPEPTRYGDWERDGRCVDF